MTDDELDGTRIRELFGVEAIVDDDGRISLTNAENAANLLSAKKYLASSRLLREGHHQKLYCRTSDVYERLLELRNNVERQSCAALNFTVATGGSADVATRSHRLKSTRKRSRVVEIGGSDDCVTTALAMVQSSFGRDCVAIVDSTLLKSLESDDDSSYDSDHENGGGGVNLQHDEVSRTVSDTLAAEFAEYIGTTSTGGGGGGGDCGGPETTRKSYDADDLTYTSRVEFALKLGYTEWQVQMALQKLGPKPEQNELLAELIKLGAAAAVAAATNSAVGSTGDDSLQSQASRGGLGGGLGVGLGTIGSRHPSSEDGKSTGVLEAIVDFKVDEPEPRPIVVDGSNVAMSHGNKDVFSCRGIKLCVDWFRGRGHSDITVFVPMWRKEASRPDALIKDQEILLDLEREGLLVFTPSRQMGGRRVACHDDRYVLRLAAETDGVVVSNDNYRDLAAENPVFKRVVEERLLMFSFANDRFMPPDDPLGRHGPSLDSFLRIIRSPRHNRSGHAASRQQTSPKPTQSLQPSSSLGSELPPPCPYGKKCTYGNKCKYYHPERGSHPHKSVCEQLAEQAKINIQEVKLRRGLPELKAVLSSPLPSKSPTSKTPLSRTKSLVPSATPVPQDGARLPHTWGDHLSVAKQLSSDQQQPPPNDDQQQQQQPSGGGNNLHRKLERQLTFNPVFDPRLVHLMNQMESGSSGQHAPLGIRHSSGGGGGGAAAAAGADLLLPSNSSAHQSVTRIASAPDSYRQWRPPPMLHHAPLLQRTISTSDTQLHHYHHHQQQQHYQHAGFRQHPFQPGATMAETSSAPFNYLPQQPNYPHPPPPGPPPPASMFQSNEEQRYRLYYHLSSLFPVDQVRAAMENNPHETDPQEICAAIFAMFPKTSASSSSSTSSPPPPPSSLSPKS